MSKELNYPRRQFLGAAALTIAAGPLAILGSAKAQSVKSSAPIATPLPPIKQIDAGVLNIGYAEAGPANGPVIVLLHGWPYDINSFADVAPILTAKGYRVIIPHLRGYGTTRFLSDSTIRNGQQSVVAVDIIALMDALKIKTAIFAGFDWGARTACIIAALWPER